jgi:hypothetical protein
MGGVVISGNSVGLSVATLVQRLFLLCMIVIPTFCDVDWGPLWYL